MKKEEESKGKYQIGTFSDNLGVGLSDVSLSEEVLNKAREIIAMEKSNIRKDISNQIYRLDSFIKKEIGVIPRVEDLTDWIFDKKTLTQTGDHFPKITDAEIIEYTKEYVVYLEGLIHPSKKEEVKQSCFKWLGTLQQLFSLYDALVLQEFICSSTSLEAFTAIFPDSGISTINKKVLWLKMGDNKMSNKKSVSDLVDVLINEGLITTSYSLPKALSHCFTFLTGDSKFAHSNLAKEGDYSVYRIDFENIVENLRDLITPDT